MKINNIPAMLTLIGVISADRISKWIILDVYQISQFQSQKITPFLDFILVYNKGIAYGWLQQETTIGYLILILITIAITIGITVWMVKTQSKIQKITLAAILAGALSNLYDRIIHGAVIDFISLHAFNVYWYVFNIADAAIVIATLRLSIDILTAEKKIS